ncbi:MAG: molybdopterin molybdotransferase MoeA [Anaerolineae bacterium]|nr:molybdopterin molybdotransferase MoeA [Anaerolineae bacterium]
MLSVEEALAQVLSAFRPLEAESVSLLESLNRVLALPVHAYNNIPPHDNSAMDGYALITRDTLGATAEEPVRLCVIENLAAGYLAKETVTPGTAIRIMTGAPLPAGANAVIQFEETRRDGEWVDIFSPVPVGQHVRRAGEDAREGDLILPQGAWIRPQDVGMLASLGIGQVLVTRRPRVAILATGDELADVDEPLAPGKIRNSNSYANAAQVLKYGGIPVMLGIARDTRDDLVGKIREGLAQHVDMFLTSGGVSVGDFDMVKTVLAAEGTMTFWRVQMKPGKPLAFGTLTATDGRPVPMLGMPGNPVSVMVSFEIFARPAIATMLGQSTERETIEAILLDPIKSKDDRRHYLRVQVFWQDGQYCARQTGEQGSGILSSMVKANGLAIIPETWDSAPAGARVKVLRLD